MNWDRIEGNWKQLKGSLKQYWGRLIDDQFVVIEGKRDQYAGRLQNSYGISQDEAERLHASWQKRHKGLRHSK